MIRVLAGAGALFVLSACATHLPPRPSGDVAADPAAIDAFGIATRGCRGVRTLTAELSLSGRAAGDHVRGRVVAGLEAGGSVRLEGLAPFGPPVFILAGRQERAMLLLPREHRVLPATGVADVLERLTGLALGADDLRLIVTSCLADDASPSEGRRWGGGWRAVTVAAGRVAYLRDVHGTPVVVAADYGAWRVDYADHAGGWPRTVRVRRGDRGGIDITARLAQLELNAPIADRAFVIDVPADATPMTLDELRSVAPLTPKSPDAPAAPSHFRTLAHRATHLRTPAP